MMYQNGTVTSFVINKVKNRYNICNYLFIHLPLPFRP